jgi:hypothetical protein
LLHPMIRSFICLRLGLYGGGGNCGRAEAGILGR